MITPSQKQELRHAVLDFLAPRSRQAYTVQSMRRLIKNNQLVDFEFADDDLADACELLCDIGFLKKFPDKLGSDVYYQISAHGIIEQERHGQ